jgi:phi13 family phage major tail protein
MAISVNADEYKSRVGLDSLYVAQVTSDAAAGYVAGTPEYFAPAGEASQEPSTSLEIQYADNQPYDVAAGEGETKINLTVTGMSLQMLALITGRVWDAASGRMWDNATGIAPYFALMFRSKKSNGKNRYYCFLKGHFEMPKEEAATMKDKPDIKTVQLTYTALKTVYQFNLGSVTDGIKRIVGDEDSTNFSGTTWFSQVQTPVVTSPSALALSSSDPTAGATGVAVTKVLTLTFNNALQNAAIYNVVLINSSTGAVVAGTNSLDATKKIMTVGHTSNLAASTLHRIVYGVVDIYGQTLSGVVSFTTA